MSRRSGLGRAMGLFRIVRKSGIGILSNRGSSRNKKPIGVCVALAKSSTWFERRLDSAFLPRRKLGKAMRERIRLQARAVASPTQQLRFDINTNHASNFPN